MGNGKKILLVDNSPVILKLISHTLRQRGHTVRTAENGLEALEVLESFKPDSIFTDLIMPKVSGDIFCQIIRSRPEFDDVLLVVLSAVAAEEDVDFLEFGADACIAKGPAKQMSEHVVYVLEKYSAGDKRGKQAEILGLEGVFKREITTELLSAKRHFEITLEHMADGFIEMTTSGRIIYANRQAVMLFGLPKEKLISSLFFDHFPKKFQSRLGRCVKGLSSGPVEIGEEEIIQIRGVRVFMKFIAVKEEQQSIIIMVRDISRQKELELQIAEHLNHLENTIALRTREYLSINTLLHDEIKKHAFANVELAGAVRQLEAVLEATSDLIAVLDRNMKISRVNRAMAEAHGRRPETLAGELCDVLIDGEVGPGQEWPHVVADLEKRTATGRVVNCLPGRTMDITCAPFSDERGICAGYIIIARDVC